MSELQQILASVKSLQSSVTNLEVKVGSLIYRQDILETTLHRLFSRLDQMFAGNGAANGMRTSTPKAEPIPSSPTPSRSNSMTPTAPTRPLTPSMPNGRPQIMASKSVGARPPLAPLGRKPVEAGNYTGTLSAEDMMGESPSSRFPGRGVGEEDDENGGAGLAYANARGSETEPSNYSSAMSSHDIESGGNYTNQLTTDSFVDDDREGMTVNMTIEPARPHPGHSHLSRDSASQKQATSPIHLPHPAIPSGKKPMDFPMTKPRSASIGTGLPIISSISPRPSPPSDPEDAPNPLKGISRTSSEDHPVYNVVRDAVRPRPHLLSRTSSNESPRFEEGGGYDGDEVQGPGLPPSSPDEEWEKYPEFDVERFSHFRRFTRDEASAKLSPHPDGVYVIRPCGDTSLKNNPDVFVLSFFARTPNNTRTLTNIKVFRFRRGKSRGFGLWGQHPDMFPTMERMVKQHLPDLRPYDDSFNK